MLLVFSLPMKQELCVRLINEDCPELFNPPLDMRVFLVLR